MLSSWGCSDPFAALAALDLSAAEVVISRELAAPALNGPAPLGDPVDRAAFASRAAREGVRVACLLMHNDFSGDVDDQVAWAVEVANLAAALGVSTVRVDLAPHSGMGTDEFVRAATLAMERVIAQSPTDVRFAVENHGHVTNDRGVLERLFSDLPASRFGLTMDTGNFYWYGLPLDEVYELLEWVAPRTYHTHLKNIRYPAGMGAARRLMGWEYEKHVCGLAEGDVDHVRVVGILKAAGYTGPLTIEDESIGHHPAQGRLELLRADAQYVRSLV